MTEKYMAILRALYNITEEIALNLKDKIKDLNLEILQGYFFCQGINKTKIQLIVVVKGNEEILLKHKIKEYMDEVLAKENKPMSFYYNYATPLSPVPPKGKKVISLRVYTKISPSLTNKEFLKYHEVLYKLGHQGQSIKDFFLHSVNLK